MKSRRCRTSRSRLMVQKWWSNIQTDDVICPCWQTTTKWSSGVERVLTRSWVFTIRCRIMLGPGTTRLTTLGNSGTGKVRAPRVTSPSQSADMSYCTIATKTLRFEELRQDRFVAKQTVWPPFNTCLGKSKVESSAQSSCPPPSSRSCPSSSLSPLPLSRLSLKFAHRYKHEHWHRH